MNRRALKRSNAGTHFNNIDNNIDNNTATSTDNNTDNNTDQCAMGLSPRWAAANAGVLAMNALWELVRFTELTAHPVSMTIFAGGRVECCEIVLRVKSRMERSGSQSLWLEQVKASATRLCSTTANWGRRFVPPHG
jgi:hypothetical protein